MFILSSMASDVKYVFYKKTPAGALEVKDSIVIKGKAGVADKKTLITPQGTATEITKAELDLLKTNATFNVHIEKGFLRVIETTEQSKAESEKETAKLEKDKSAQLTPEDYKEKKVKPKTKDEEK
jgi:hypothetical protein